MNLVRLEVSQFRFQYKSFDFKSRSSASAQRIFCGFKFRSFAQYTVTWISAVPLLQEKTSFEIPHFCFCTRTLLFFGKSTLIQPPTHFLILLSYMNDGPSEGQWNKRIGLLLAKVVVNVWLREAWVDDTLCSYWHSSRPSAQAGFHYDRENEAVLLCWHKYVNAFGRRQYLPDVMGYLPIRSITVCGKSNYLISADRH